MDGRIEIWNNYHENPIYTYGQHGKEFTLKLVFTTQFYGRENIYKESIIKAVWDSIDEAFYEKDTGLKIYKYGKKKCRKIIRNYQ